MKFLSRLKRDREEKKNNPDYRPTKDLEVDESELSEEEKGHFVISLQGIIVIIILLLLIAGVIVTICLL